METTTQETHIPVAPVTGASSGLGGATAALPAARDMRRRGAGRIVDISSMAGAA
ncbi:hypothetical protein [Sorangium sp. So ce385]|uniref:hypothetical protein n=1 Tax=Sorangium sp. So ce385 TaxID=3133308 RepID=UPI003F5C5CD3